MGDILFNSIKRFNDAQFPDDDIDNDPDHSVDMPDALLDDDSEFGDETEV